MIVLMLHHLQKHKALNNHMSIPHLILQKNQLKRLPTSLFLSLTTTTTSSRRSTSIIPFSKIRMSSQISKNSNIASGSIPSHTPGEEFEPRQTHPTEDYTPDPSKSLPLSPARQALIDDIIALYSCQPTVERVKRYTPDCVYDDQFVYANDRYKMAGQWFALPKLFKKSVNEGYQVVKNEKGLIQFRNEQSWTFKIIPKTATINALVSLSLDPDTVDSDLIQVKYHKDQANDKDYSHEGVGFSFKKWQADQVAKHMDAEEVQAFKADEAKGHVQPKKYGSGKAEGDAPVEDL